MKKLNKTILAITFISISLIAKAGGTESGMIKNIYIRASDGLVYFNLIGTTTGQPSCATSGVWMIKDENSQVGKRQIAALIAARLAGQTVVVYGAGTCLRGNDGEDVEVVVL